MSDFPLYKTFAERNQFLIAIILILVLEHFGRNQTDIFRLAELNSGLGNS